MDLEEMASFDDSNFTTDDNLWIYESNFTLDGNGTDNIYEIYHNSIDHKTLLVAEFIYALLCVAGLLGNTFVIYVMLRYSKMHEVTNTYIINLAIADGCFLISIPFLITNMTLRSWPFGYFMCKTYMVSTGINQSTSSIFICIMSADRYVAVCRPHLDKKLRTPTVSFIVSGVAWAASACIMIPIIMYTTLVPVGNGLTCNIIWPEDDSNKGRINFIIYSFVCGFVVPSSLVFVFYCLVLRKLKTVGPNNKSKEKKRSHRKVTKLVLTVIAVYVMCCLPYWMTQVWLIYSPGSGTITISLSLLVSCLCYSNSVINPLLYVFLSEDFKENFLNVCTCVTRMRCCLSSML